MAHPRASPPARRPNWETPRMQPRPAPLWSPRQTSSSSSLSSLRHPLDTPLSPRPPPAHRCTRAACLVAILLGLSCVLHAVNIHPYSPWLLPYRWGPRGHHQHHHRANRNAITLPGYVALLHPTPNAGVVHRLATLRSRFHALQATFYSSAPAHEGPFMSLGPGPNGGLTPAASVWVDTASLLGLGSPEANPDETVEKTRRVWYAAEEGPPSPMEWQSLDYECFEPHSLPLPILLEDGSDRAEWLFLERPYDGCDAQGDVCRFRGGCSSYQVIHNAKLIPDKMGECRNHPYLETQRVESDGKICDMRILVPLDVPEGLYFGQLHNMLQRLLRIWFRESARERNLWLAGDRTGQPPQPKFLLYTQSGGFDSKDTEHVLRRLGVEVTTRFPEQCFERILWGCHIVNFDPTTPKLMPGLMRHLFDPNGTVHGGADRSLSAFDARVDTTSPDPPPVTLPPWLQSMQPRRRFPPVPRFIQHCNNNNSQNNNVSATPPVAFHQQQQQTGPQLHAPPAPPIERSRRHGRLPFTPSNMSNMCALAATLQRMNFSGRSDVDLNRTTDRNCTHVYASRYHTNTNNDRELVNELELIYHLRTKHQFCIFDGREPLRTWAAALRHTKVFMGPHGGALTHLYWLDPKNDPVVIELDGYNKYAIFWLHAASAGFRYAWMSFDQNAGVNLGRVDALLQKSQR